MKMARSESIKWNFLIFLSLMTFNSFGVTDPQKETHNLLLGVNKNWADLGDEIEHTFTPNSEKELLQLHLLNVLSYLEKQPYDELNKTQIENRHLNISILQEYCIKGDFPVNTKRPFRLPIFIDDKNVHCAVGYLLKENGFEDVAQEIAENYLLSYLADIEHPHLTAWLKTCGLTLFELALIQPTYGPPRMVCAAPSPIKWNGLQADNSGITKLFQNDDKTSFYALHQLDEFGLRQEVKSYSSITQQWSIIGSEVSGEILDLTVHKEQIYISVILPEEDYPHQLLKLSDTKWKKVAHFNGSIISIQSFQEKLYVLGNFKQVNSVIATSLLVIDNKSLQAFNPLGVISTRSFDLMKSSETALFLTGRGGIYNYKNDSLNYLRSIQYYSDITNITLDAIHDTLFVTSLNTSGYTKYFYKSEQAFYINNLLYAQNYPYGAAHFTKTKMINGKMVIAGDFKTSTLTTQVNDERQLIKCKESESSHWYGEGLLYEYDRMHYPILEKGIVLDFVHINDQIYILKKDGSISFANINAIEEQIIELLKKNGSGVK